VAHGDLLDALLTESIAVLNHEGLVDMKRVSHDGMRVRASAGAASFRRKASLRDCRKEAEEQIRALRRELEEDPAQGNERQRAARERAAQDRKRRIKEALRQMPEVEEKRRDPKHQDARVSSTDPDCRIMKMADGGFRPAYNVQVAADVVTQLVVGVDVTNQGSDTGQLGPMMDRLHCRYGTVPKDVLADTGFANRIDIELLSRPPFGCRLYIPPPAPRSTRPRGSPRLNDTPHLEDWRRRMASAAGQAIYRLRAATSECVNALMRNRGLTRFVVRGIEKVRAVALWHALAHNMMRGLALRAR
jgi:hypothetical protein